MRSPVFVREVPLRYVLRALRFLLPLLLVGVCVADEITVAAASDLQYALQDVAARFEKQTGNTVRLTFGSSGSFFAQISNGAPFDVFLSADAEYPRKLVEQGAADKASLQVYGIGKLVLWAPSGSKFDVDRGVKGLLDASVKKIAIANPQHAPYGRAAVAAMKHEGVYDRLAARLVMGENISQTMHFMESGNVDVGFVALSLAVAPVARGKGRFSTVPQEFYTKIEQAGVVVSRSSKKKTASDFLAFLNQSEIVDLMKTYGFERPVEKR
jgi:molybdate transport system substrate-binding protein